MRAICPSARRCQHDGIERFWRFEFRHVADRIEHMECRMASGLMNRPGMRFNRSEAVQVADHDGDRRLDRTDYGWRIRREEHIHGLRPTCRGHRVSQPGYDRANQGAGVWSEQSVDYSGARFGRLCRCTSHQSFSRRVALGTGQVSSCDIGSAQDDSMRSRRVTRRKRRGDDAPP